MRRRVHFLHIGKNAGNEICRYLGQLNQVQDAIEFVAQPHDVYLIHLPEPNEYLFSIRDPIARFRSGFYSRKRKGQPKLYSEWTAYDALAFRDFEHASDLAEALFAEGEAGCRAFAAMKSIRHTSQNQTDWFYCCGHFLSIRPPLAIIRQEKFSQDIFALQRKLGIGAPAMLPSDDVASHVNDYRGLPELSNKAIENLRRWYAQDFEFYRMCNDWIERRDNP
jgi:hypothetical protein